MEYVIHLLLIKGKTDEQVRFVTSSNGGPLFDFIPASRAGPALMSRVQRLEQEEQLNLLASFSLRSTLERRLYRASQHKAWWAEWQNGNVSWCEYAKVYMRSRISPFDTVKTDLHLVPLYICYNALFSIYSRAIR